MGKSKTLFRSRTASIHHPDHATGNRRRSNRQRNARRYPGPLPPRNVSKKAEEADSVRHFLRGVWMNWRRWGSDIDVDRDFGKNMFMHGMAVTKTVPDWTLWPTLPDEVIAQMKSDGKTAELKGR